MQQAYNTTSNAHKLHQNKHILLHRQTPNTQTKAHKSYYLKPLGRVTVSSLFILLAILSAYITPEAGEGSVFLVILAIIVLVSKDKEIKIILKCKQ